MPEPYVESFLMLEDIRFEKSGQFTLIGALSDRVFSKAWPLRFPKTCFHVRVRGVHGTPDHKLEIRIAGAEKPLATLSGKAKESDVEVAIICYFFGPEFSLPEPGSYVVTFSLHEAEERILKAEYTFSLRNPNADELYLQCEKCKAKYATGVAVKGTAQIEECTSVCPLCGNANPFDSKKAFHIPNPS